jgi:hypothetical protein
MTLCGPSQPFEMSDKPLLDRARPVSGDMDPCERAVDECDRRDMTEVDVENHRHRQVAESAAYASRWANSGASGACVRPMSTATARSNQPANRIDHS